MDWTAVFIEEVVGEFHCCCAVKTFHLVVNCSSNVGWEFAENHLFDDVVDGDASDLVFDVCKHLRRQLPVSLDAVQDDGCLLRFCAPISISKICFELCPILIGAVAEDELIDARVGVDGEFGFDKCEFILRVGYSGAAVRVT